MIMKKQETIFSELIKLLNKNLGKILDINLIAESMVEKGLMIRETNGKIYMVTLKDYKSTLKTAGYLESKRGSNEIKVLKLIPTEKKTKDFY